MRRICRRALALWVLVAVLLGGLGYFGYEYWTQAEAWALHSGSPHVYSGGSQMVSKGIVVDRDGVFLLSCDGGRIYCQDGDVRAAMVHWLGDRSGNIRSAVLDAYAKELVGFDRVNGVYGYSDETMTLTFSAQVQTVAMEALGNYKGTIAVMDYRTGEILCAVSKPCFDPDAVPDISQEAFAGVYWNRFTQAAYVPGSIFKIVTTAAALEWETGVAQREFQCTGRLALPGGSVTCERAHGLQDMAQALKNSCNCYYADLTVSMGAQAMTDAVERYGVLSQVRFDGIGTAAGHFSVENAAAVELAWAGIGQHTDLVNPCAFLRFVAAIANEGVAVMPVAVRSVGGKLVWRQEGGTPVMKVGTAKTVARMMRNNVQQGYGDQNFPAGLRVCAKSGTGEVDGTKKSYAMFTGFVENAEYPLAFFVAVEDAGYGKQVCMPMVNKVLSACRTVLEREG